MSPIRFLSTFTFSFNVVLGCVLIFKMCFIKKLGQPHQHLAGDGSLVKDLSGFYAMLAPKEFMRGLHQKVGPSATPWALGRCPGCQGQVAVRPTRHLTLVNGASQRSDCQNGAVETYPTSFIDEGQTLFSPLPPHTEELSPENLC